MPTQEVYSFPYDLRGAMMHIVDPENHGRGLEQLSLKTDEFDEWPLVVGFQFPCQTNITLDASWCFECKQEKGPHGHFVLQCDDGTTVVPATVFSRPYAEKIIDALPSFSPEEKQAMKTVLEDALQKLAPELQPEEIAVLADAKLLKKAANYGAWYSL